MAVKILNVDDDPTIRHIVREMLLASDIEVLSAENGEAALQVVEEQPKPLAFDAIILDVEMPGMSGLDLLTRLKLHSETEGVPVIMLTCQSAPEDVMEGYNLGASYYITKPFTRDQLLYGLEMVGVTIPKKNSGSNEPE